MVFPSLHAQEQRRSGLTTAEKINVRSGPSLSYEIVLKLSKGSKVQVLAREGEWYQVVLPEEVSVYVAKPYLLVGDPAAKIRGHRVHVRSGPGISFTALAFLEEGDGVEVRGAVGDWVKIKPTAACHGWVHSAYITLLNPEESSDDHH